MQCLFCGVEVQKPGACEKCRQERIKKMAEEDAAARAKAAEALKARQAAAAAAAVAPAPIPAPGETLAPDAPEGPPPAAPMEPKQLIWIGLGVLVAFWFGAI